jgi:hypothetical protein
MKRVKECSGWHLSVLKRLLSLTYKKPSATNKREAISDPKKYL